MDGYYSHGSGGIFDPTVAVDRAFPSGHAFFFASVVIRDSDLYLVAYIPAGGGGGADYDDGEPYSNGGFGSMPASEEEIAKLEEVAAGETIVDAACGMCLESFEEDEGGSMIRKMMCSHGFHKGCMCRWLRVCRLCPCWHFVLPAAATDDDEGEDDADTDQLSDSGSSLSI